MILLVDDEQMMAECWQAALEKVFPATEVQICGDALVALDSVNQQIPELIILDILLEGPDGFSFLNELISYDDTMRIPVVIISSLDFRAQDLSHYGVRAVLAKEILTPELLVDTVREVLADAE